MYINVLEIKAIAFGIKSFLNMVENVTAVTDINNLGGVQSIDCHKIAKEAWVQAVERGNHISAEHLPGSNSILADRASRVFDVNTELELDSSVHHKVFGKPYIDLFALTLNVKHNNYVSQKPDPNASFVDSISASWFDIKLQAFPRFSVVMK